MPRIPLPSKICRKTPPKVALFIETSNAYARGVLAGIEDYLRGHGPWNVYLGEQGRGSPPPHWLAKWDGDGIIARIENRSIAVPILKTGIPVVDVSAARLAPDAPAVTTHNEAVSQMAVQHFIERGFRHFAFCGDGQFSWSVSREGYFVRALKARGFACATYSPPMLGMDSEAEGEAISEWLLEQPQPLAVFACYDARGQRVLEACRQAGLAVPEQVAVLGVDNDELICSLTPPPLSSVILDPARTGWEAASMLARLMHGEAVPPEKCLIRPLGVATRQSTDILAVDDPQIAKALRFIREHACDGIGVSDVLRNCPMARRNFEARLKAITGRSPREEISRVQMNRVKELLAGTDLSLAEIAERTGFKHVEYMTVVFKRECAQTPSAYRIETVHGMHGAKKRG